MDLSESIFFHYCESHKDDQNYYGLPHGKVEHHVFTAFSKKYRSSYAKLKLECSVSLYNLCIGSI